MLVGALSSQLRQVRVPGFSGPQWRVPSSAVPVLLCGGDVLLGKRPGGGEVSPERDHAKLQGSGVCCGWRSEEPRRWGPSHAVGPLARAGARSRWPCEKR